MLMWVNLDNALAAWWDILDPAYILTDETTLTVDNLRVFTPRHAPDDTL